MAEIPTIVWLSELLAEGADIVPGKSRVSIR